MNIQIDLKPCFPPTNFSSYYMNLYIDGRCYQSIISKAESDRLINDGIVQQVKGHRHNDVTGQLEEFEYENKLDGAGVQHTSKVFEVEPIAEPV